MNSSKDKHSYYASHKKSNQYLSFYDQSKISNNATDANSNSGSRIITQPNHPKNLPFLNNRQLLFSKLTSGETLKPYKSKKKEHLSSIKKKGFNILSYNYMYPTNNMQSNNSSNLLSMQQAYFNLTNSHSKKSVYPKVDSFTNPISGLYLTGLNEPEEPFNLITEIIQTEPTNKLSNTNLNFLLKLREEKNKNVSRNLSFKKALLPMSSYTPVETEINKQIAEKRKKMQFIKNIKEDTEGAHYFHKLLMLEQNPDSYYNIFNNIQKNNKDNLKKIEKLRAELVKCQGSPRDVITKSREISLIQYKMRVNTFAEKQIKTRYNENIKNFQETINKLNYYKTNFIEKMEEDLVSSVRNLERKKEHESKLKYDLAQHIIRLKALKDKLLTKVKATIDEKRLIENWILLFIYIKTGDKNVMKYLIKINNDSSNYKINENNKVISNKIKQLLTKLGFLNKNIFQSMEEFDIKFKEPEERNLKFYKLCQHNNEEITMLKRKLNDFEEEDKSSQRAYFLYHLKLTGNFKKDEEIMLKHIEKLKNKNNELKKTYDKLMDSVYDYNPNRISLLKTEFSSSSINSIRSLNINNNEHLFYKNKLRTSSSCNNKNKKKKYSICDKIINSYNNYNHIINNDKNSKEIFDVMEKYQIEIHAIHNRTEKIMRILFYSEFLFDYLNAKIKKLKCNPEINKQLKKIKDVLKLNLRITKDAERKKEELEKEKLKRMKVADNINKIYFIEKRKVENYPYARYFNLNKSDKNVKEKPPGIEDFLYDLSNSKN